MNDRGTYECEIINHNDNGTFDIRWTDPRIVDLCLKVNEIPVKGQRVWTRESILYKVSRPRMKLNGATATVYDVDRTAKTVWLNFDDEELADSNLPISKLVTIEDVVEEKDFQFSCLCWKCPCGKSTKIHSGYNMPRRICSIRHCPNNINILCIGCFLNRKITILDCAKQDQDECATCGAWYCKRKCLARRRDMFNKKEDEFCGGCNMIRHNIHQKKRGPMEVYRGSDGKMYTKLKDRRRRRLGESLERLKREHKRASRRV